MNTYKITLKIDTDPLLPTLKLLKAFPEVIDGLVEVIGSANSLIRVEQNDLSADTGELLIRLHPSERLLSFMVAAGAGNFDFN